MCTFFFSLYILLLIIDMVILVRIRQENVLFLLVWLCAQTLDTLMVLGELLTLMPWCITKRQQIQGPFVLSILKTAFTCFFLVAVYVYKMHLKVQLKRHIQEISWKSIPTEVQQTNIQEVSSNTVSKEVQQVAINEQEDCPPPYSEHTSQES
jgi:hypothetical protein